MFSIAICRPSRNNVFDCHLSPVGEQMAIEKTDSYCFLFTFVDSINVYACRLPKCCWKNWPWYAVTTLIWTPVEKQLLPTNWNTCSMLHGQRAGIVLWSKNYLEKTVILHSDEGFRGGEDVNGLFGNKG